MKTDDGISFDAPPLLPYIRVIFLRDKLIVQKISVMLDSVIFLGGRDEKGLVEAWVGVTVQAVMMIAFGSRPKPGIFFFTANKKRAER